MKWYFCLNEAGLNIFAECVVVAVNSALQNTTLEPNFIYDGTPNALTDYLQKLGVKVHFHQNSFLTKINASAAGNGFNSLIARGAYLRLDIPVVDPSDDIVLYTDVDVIFCSDPTFEVIPDTIAACAEYAIQESGPKEYAPVFNSGVMLINLAGLRNELPALLKLCDEHGFYFHGIGGFYDQGALNLHFAGRSQALPQSLNWRCFSRSELEPVIIHFHGTKLYELASLVSGGRAQREIANRFFDLDKGSYIWAFGLYVRFLCHAAEDAIKRAAPVVQNLAAFEDAHGLAYLRFINDVCSFRFMGKRIVASSFYGSEYLHEFQGILEKYIVPRQEVRILEWGSGFTTILMRTIIGRKCKSYRIDSYDTFGPYQKSVASSLLFGDSVVFHLEDVTGTGESQCDPGLNFSTSPLRISGTPDLIFIDSRRRVECAYIASLIAGRETIVVIHDFRRERYQPVLGLFDVIEETEQFRVMKVNEDVHRVLAKRRAKVKDSMPSVS